MEQWLSIRLDELNTEELRFLLVVMGAVGLLYCFLGYRLFKLILGLTGFALAGAVAGVGAGWLSQGHVAIMAGAALFGGLCGAMALFFLYKTGVFCLGFLGMLVVAHNALQTRAEPWAPWAILGCAAVGGLLALFMERPVMTLATAAIGAWLIFFSATFYALGEGFAGRLTDPANERTVYYVLLAGWAAVALMGAAFQFASFRSRRSKAMARRG